MNNTGHTKKLPLFWRIFLISAAAFLAVICVLLIVFWNLMSSYQKSLPETVLREKLTNANERYWFDIISNSLEIELTPFESRDTVANKLAETYSSSAVSFVKKYDESTDDEVVYTLIRSGGKFATVKLIPGKNCGFGFTSWDIKAVELIPEAFEIARYTADIIVPHGATLMIGGAEVGREYYAAAPGSVENRFGSKFEAKLPERFMCDIYSVSGLMFDILPEATYNGCDLEYKMIGDKYIFDYPDSMKHKLTITAPLGAEITLGGVILDLSPSSTGSYTGSIFENNRDGLPKYATYTIDGLLTSPKAHAELDGAELDYTTSENEITFAYPEDLKYTVVISVPAGATVAVNGINVEDSFITETSADAELSSKSYSGFITDIPMRNTYHIEGLYCKPDIEVTVNGEPISAANAASSSDRAITERYDLPYSDVIPSEAVSEAVAFAKSFMYYTACGFTGINENLARVQSHTLAGSEAYKNITASYIGVYYNDYYELIYNKLESTGGVKYSDSCVKVGLAFDTYRNIYSYSFHDEGEYDIILVNLNGRWLVADFVMK